MSFKVRSSLSGCSFPQLVSSVQFSDYHAELLEYSFELVWRTSDMVVQYVVPEIAMTPAVNEYDKILLPRDLVSDCYAYVVPLPSFDSPACKISTSKFS